jgi:ribosomal protein L29
MKSKVACDCNNTKYLAFASGFLHCGLMHDWINICRDLKIKKLQQEVDDLKAMLAEERISSTSQFQQVMSEIHGLKKVEMTKIVFL